MSRQQRGRFHATSVVGFGRALLRALASVDLASDLTNGTPVRRFIAQDLSMDPSHPDASVAARGPCARISVLRFGLQMSSEMLV